MQDRSTNLGTSNFRRRITTLPALRHRQLGPNRGLTPHPCTFFNPFAYAPRPFFPALCLLFFVGSKLACHSARVAPPLVEFRFSLLLVSTLSLSPFPSRPAVFRTFNHSRGAARVALSDSSRSRSRITLYAGSFRSFDAEGSMKEGSSSYG